MTTETQTFIALDDILGIRFACECGSKLSLPMEDEAPSCLFTLRRCPNCNKEWFQGDRDQQLLGLNALMKQLIGVRDRIAGFPMRVMLEIKASAASREGA